MPSNIKNPRIVETPAGGFEIRYSEKTERGYRTRVLSCRTNSSDAAEAFLTNWLIQIESAQETVSTPRLKDLCAHYSSFLESAGKGDTSLICVEHIKRELGSYYPADLKPHVIDRYRTTRRVKSGTLRRELGVLRAVLSYAVKHEYIDKAPHIDLPPASEPRRVYLREDEERAFHRIAMEYSNGEKRLRRVSRFIAIGLCTGQRKEAIEALTWDRVDLVAGTIDFRMPGRAVSNKRQSVAPISKRLAPILRRAWDERTSKYVLDHGGSIRSEWRTLLATPEMAPFAKKGMHMHAMRRTFATLAIHAGVNPADVAAVVGDTLEVILRHYLAEMPKAKTAAVNARFG